MKVLILFAHPAFHKSKVNKILVDGLSELEGVTFHDLYEHYPEFDIDVKEEQKLLSEHDCIIFQHPIFWYSTPAILKEWQDLVLEHGWAFGSEGNALKEKLFFCTLTAGGPEQAYQVGGYHNHTLNQLLAPLKQTATLCKMIPLPPFVVHGTHAMETDEVLDHKNDYFTLLKTIVDDKLDLDRVSKLNYLNHYLIKEEL
jgi:glutathione-regulated potassium-efflux system ancillary protein KefG